MPNPLIILKTIPQALVLQPFRTTRDNYSIYIDIDLYARYL